MARSRDLLKFRQDERSGPLSYGMDKSSAQRRPSTEICGGARMTARSRCIGISVGGPGGWISRCAGGF
jgi:hypothetical protein